MKIIVDNINIECFETELDYKEWNKENYKFLINLGQNLLYSGSYYGIPQNIRDLFKENILVSIRRLNTNDTKYVVIYK